MADAAGPITPGRTAPGAAVAVIGGGWAGSAAATALAAAGRKVTLLEAARTLGGRARGVEMAGRVLDNGQHIMLGAYAATLQLLKTLGVDRKQALLTVPLQMRYAPDSGGMDFLAPRLPAPLHLLGALWRARGLEREDKMSLARFSSTARWMGWQMYDDCTVTELLQRFDQTPRLTALMWRPLCLAALNTPPERASAQVFLNVLRDSLGASRAASDMLVPSTDLGALLPAPAAAFVTRHGGTVHTGAKATALIPLDSGRWQVHASGAALGNDDSAPWQHSFDAVVLATPPLATAVLLDTLSDTPAHVMAAGLSTQLHSFQYEAITTCYLQYAPGVRLDMPFVALIDDPASQQWGQFVFDRGQLDPAQAGLLAVVISASGDAAAQGQAALATALAAQLASVFRRPELAQPVWTRVITEKRATFACTSGLRRPANATGIAGLVLAGDYTAGDYPATLEGAVRSGQVAAKLLISNK